LAHISKLGEVVVAFSVERLPSLAMLAPQVVFADRANDVSRLNESVAGLSELLLQMFLARSKPLPETDWLERLDGNVAVPRCLLVLDSYASKPPKRVLCACCTH